MSKILIISDSHFLRKNKLDEFVSQFDNLKAIIHCGDIYMTYKPGDISGLYLCKGNNDFNDAPQIGHFSIDDIPFIITHGHLNDYAYHPERLKELTKKYPGKIICFGHTHVPYLYQDDEVTIINPGSLSLGRGYPRRNTYILLDTDDCIPHFYDEKTNEEFIVENKNK